jgi:hypothetical protein
VSLGLLLNYEHSPPYDLLKKLYTPLAFGRDRGRLFWSVGDRSKVFSDLLVI